MYGLSFQLEALQMRPLLERGSHFLGKIIRGSPIQTTPAPPTTLQTQA